MPAAKSQTKTTCLLMECKYPWILTRKVDIFSCFLGDIEIGQSGWAGANTGARSNQNNLPDPRFSLTITAQPESLGSSPLLRTATLAKAAKDPRFDAETGSTKFSR